ncbi:RNase adapter RapZ [Desulfococcaceae bacterium HSG9]|nr:RNase adapter RapZ [Desulfococcaceae bacterium HSG9]
MYNFKIFIITGQSGSGKSTALAAFEDAGFYCVDNMPVVLLPKFLELLVQNNSDSIGLAFVMDLREKEFPAKSSNAFSSLRKEGWCLTILFLETDENILLRRYSQTRRYHPLSHEKTLLESIRIEVAQLKKLRITADRIIDTSNYNVHEFKASITEIARSVTLPAAMKINVTSFGFKNGPPREADLIIDVRFLPNPYFVPDLKDLDGESKAIQKYLMGKPETQIFLKKYLDLLDYLIPLYKKEGKSYLTLGIGCTGGRHRSVTIAIAVSDHIEMKQNYLVTVSHRDINR